MRLSRTARLSQEGRALWEAEHRSPFGRHRRVTQQGRETAEAESPLEGDSFLPDRDLAIPVLLIVRELRPGRDREDEREQLVLELCHGSGTVEQRAGVEVDPVRLLC